MGRVFMKGTEAIAEAAVRSGCRFFAGYPITPQNEIPEYFARRMPEVGGVFVQGESEVASVNMVYGAAQSGTRAMTSSSSCGISLKSEGISFCASARIPMVYVNVQRGGPGIGAIQPAQQDYLQATRASGNGGFRMMVFAPATVQEAVDMTYAAFDYAQRDRNPVLILTDGVLGTIMEPVSLPEMRSDEEVKRLKDELSDWALVGHPADKKERKKALSRLNMELVAQSVRYRGESVLAYQTAGNHECSLNYYGPELFPQRGFCIYQKTIQSHSTQVEASCIRELWILEDGRFVEVSCVNTKYRSAYERFSTCYRTIHHIVRERDWQDYPAEEVADAFEDISRYPFDGRPGVFYEV